MMPVMSKFVIHVVFTLCCNYSDKTKVYQKKNY